jgi:hypothetical protein
MGAYTAIAAIGLSIEKLLNGRFDAMCARHPQAFNRKPQARLVKTEDFNRSSTPGTTGSIDDGTVSIFCYRIAVSAAMRPPWSAVSAHEDGAVRLPLDVHFLLTAFESDAEAELKLLGLVMLSLEQTPILAGPQLHHSGRWQPGESVQLISEEISTEDVLRTFDTLPGDFRPSLSYVARIVRIDAEPEAEGTDVLTVVRGLVPTSTMP